MRYVILFDNYNTAYANLQWSLKRYEKDLDIRKVDERKLVVELTNGDEVHYMLVYGLEQWQRAWRECNVITSLGDLIERKEE